MGTVLIVAHPNRVAELKTRNPEAFVCSFTGTAVGFRADVIIFDQSIDQYFASHRSLGLDRIERAFEEFLIRASQGCSIVNFSSWTINTRKPG